MNFVKVTHLFTFPVMHQLAKLRPASWPPFEPRGESNNPMIGLGASVILRGHDKITKANWLDDLPVRDKPELESWASMKNLLKRASRAIMAHPIGDAHLSGQLARVMLSRLDAAPQDGGNSIFWHVDDGAYHSRTARFHVPLVTNPVCLMYSGPEGGLHFPVGDLFYINNHVRHSAANFGNEGHYRVHLIFEMYKKSAAVDDDAE